MISTHLIAWPTLTICLFVISLIVLSYIDIKTGLLPDMITQPLLWLGLILSVFEWGLVDSKTAILGAACGYLVLWLVNYIYWLIRNTQGMGHGDFKLLAAIGAWLGWQPLNNILLVASLSGVAVALFMKWVSQKPAPVSIPFGPFLALGGVVTLLS
jgi:leader peptidase (prepilin peptidase)/N-methyltransferase